MSTELLFDPSRLPPRDAQGFTFHPDLSDERWQHPQWEEYLNPDAFTAAGLETADVTLEHDLDPLDPVYLAWENGGSDFSLWQPSMPSGEGWRLIAIYDSEDSPVALYVREIVRGHA